MLKRFLSDNAVRSILAKYTPKEVSTYAFFNPTPQDRESLRALLTLTSTDKKNPFTLYLYEDRDDGLFGVPRALYQREKPPTLSDNYPINFYGVLRPEQKEIYNNVIGSVVNLYGGIIKATTGVGKTVIALAIASHLKQPTLIIVPTNIIMNQWLKAIKEFLRQDAGVIRQNQCEVKTFSVALIHSLAKRGDYNLKDKFGLVIYDEIHKVSAETFSRTAGMFNCIYRLGLSATPRRRDGMENVFLWHIGSIVAQHISKEVKPKIYMVQYRSPATSSAGCVYNGDLLLGRYINKVVIDIDRNKMIANYIYKAYNQDREILVLSDRVMQLEVIKSYLISKGINDIGFVTAQKKQPSRQVLLATYGCAGIGFDKPSLDTLIFATPHADIEQAVGRLLRRASKKKQPIVIDIVDRASSFMEKWALKRYKQYIAMGGEVINVERK